jgi:hypothetical protein
MEETWILAGVGVVLLLFGRKLFWLVVALAGAVFAYRLAETFLDPGQSALWVAVLAGLAGAFLAVMIQKLAIRVVGFLLGFGATAWLFDAGVAGLHWPEPGGLALLALVVGGLLGALLAGWLFRVALVLLSSLVGASLILGAVPVEGWVEALAFAVLAVIGVVVQGAGGRRRRSR